MPRAVRFDKYGGIEVLQVVEVDRPPGVREAYRELKQRHTRGKTVLEPITQHAILGSDA